MRLENLLQDIKYNVLKGSTDIEIQGITYDSRKVSNNGLFICINGKRVNGHNYIEKAIINGAKAIIVEEDIICNSDITIIKVSNSSRIVAYVANRFYDQPSSDLDLIGITGTNGKTSTTSYVQDMLMAHRYKVGTIGTLGYKINNVTLDIEQINPTTPKAIELQHILAEFRENEVERVIMEVSSSALAKYKVNCCNFNVGVFTNLTQDHLEEHGTMQKYKKEKMKLFNMCKMAVVNIDDEVGREIVKTSSCKKITYGIDKDADVRATNLYLNGSSVSFTLEIGEFREEININIPGKFTVYNVLASIGVLYSIGIDKSEIVSLTKFIRSVPGRLQLVENHRNKNVIVDYAHTPDALESLMKVVKSIKKDKVILIFGCSGERDSGKRVIMGKIAGEYANYCIITSDNPANEDVDIILNQIENGLISTDIEYEKIIDRRSAIKRGIDLLGDDDLLVLAGKGHENYQIIGDKKVYFNDSEVAREFLS